MTHEAAGVDITTMPELVRLAHQVLRTRTPMPLEEGGEVVAFLVPPRPRRRRPHVAPPTPAQRKALLSSIGSWKGLLDAEQFKREIKAARSSKRPSVEL